MDISFYQMRIANIDEAAKRNRWIFAISIVASIVIFGASWNSAPLGLYDFASDMWQNGFAKDEPTVELQKALLKGWVESMFVNIPLFGIRFSVNDVWFLGTMTLFIISVWDFYGSRRENHLIGGLLRDVAGEDQRMRALVFYGVCGTQVFATLTNDDSPISSIEHTKPLTTPAIRPTVRLLRYLPALVIIYIVISDLASVFWWGAPFRTGHASHWSIAASKGTNEIIKLLGPIAIEDGIALCFAFVTAFLLWRANHIQQGTVQLLRTLDADHWGTIPPGEDPEKEEAPRPRRRSTTFP